MKQTRLWLTTIAVLLCNLTASAHDFEVDGIYYVITSETDLTVSVTYQGRSYSSYSNEYSGAVTIPTTVNYNGKTYSVTSILYAFYDCDNLTSITIPESVKSIGNYAFYRCSSLTSIAIPEGVKSIGEHAFYRCSSLTSITIPESVTSIGNSAFDYCGSLSSIIVAEDNTVYDSRNGCNAIIGTSSNTLIRGCSSTVIPESVTSIGSSAFDGCTGLTSITIPESVKSIGNYAFNHCTSLKEVIFEDGSETLKLGYGDYYRDGTGSGIFSSCPLENVYLGRNLSYSSGQSYGYSPFYNKTKLTTLTIGKGVKRIGDYAFDGCSSLTSITLPEGVTSIGSYAFHGCTGLTSITIPEGVTSIGDSAFYGCCSLTSITLPEGVKSIGDCAFCDCCSLTSITIPEGVTRIGWITFYGCNSLTSITIPEGVKSIGDGAFEGCSSLTSITLPEGVTSIGRSAFEGCYKLTSITVPESVTSIGSSAFEYTAWYGNLPDGVVYVGKVLFEYKGFMPENTSIEIKEGTKGIGEGAFVGCSNLVSITIPESVVDIGYYAFYDCGGELVINCDIPSTRYYESGAFYKSKFTKVTITDGVKSIGNCAFFGCTSLKEVVVEDGSETLNLGYNYIDYYYGDTGLFGDCPLERVYIGRNLSYNDYSPFYNKTKLTTLTIGEGVTSIGSSAFEGCSSFTSITIPESVTSIGNSAFEGCSSLTSITIPENSQMMSIGSRAFYGCVNLTSITIPEGVKNIGTYAFSSCSGELTINCNIPSATGYSGGAFYNSRFTKVTIGENVTSIGTYAFYNCNSLNSIAISESVTSIGKYTFGNCSSLTEVHISNIEAWCNIDFESVSSNPLFNGSNLYLNGELVTTLMLPNTVTAIKNYAFYGCCSLTSITFPDGVTSIGTYAFNGCNGLTSITIPAGVTRIGYYVFCNCNNLISIIVDEGNTVYDSRNGCNAIIITNSNTLIAGCATTIIPESVTSIEGGVFEGCSSLATITIPEGVKSIGSSAFEGCSSLTSITIPEGVKSIAMSTFKDCSSLTSIVLPKSIKGVYNDAFSNCFELTDVYCYAESIPSTSTDAFDRSNIKYATLHVPANAVANYKSTAPWSGFGKFETINIPVERIMLSQSTTTLTEGETLILTATVSPDDASDKSISWSSSIPSVATVDSMGKVTAIAPGTATITAKANDGSGVSASCEVTVLEARYVITYIVDGEVFATDTLTCGAAITLLDEPTKEGYTFSGWSEAPETMPAHDVIISGTFTPNKYLVTFKIGDEVIAADSLECGAAIIAPIAPEKEGHTFKGWGEMAETVPASDVTYEGSYTVSSYLLTYIVGGETVQTDSITYGTAIPLPEAPTKEGYTFSGWSEAPKIMPAKDVVISGAFTINKYLVTFKIDDEVMVADSLEYGAIIVAPEAPEREGHTFNGWGEVAETVPAGDVTYDGSYTVNIYKVYYYVGEELVHSAEVAYGEAIPEYIYEPTGEGDIFEGWVGETYETMPAHDVAYVANITNGIDQLTMDNGQWTIYDLTGRKVTSTENLKGGIYIVNGRKVVIGD